MERVLQKVDKTILEAPGVTPYLPLATRARSARSARSGSRHNDRLRPPPPDDGRVDRLVPAVPADQQLRRSSRKPSRAIVVRFGKPVRILNRYEAGEPFGSAGPASPGASRSPKMSSGSTSACATSTWSASRCCRPTSCGSRSTPSPATASSIRLRMYIAARTEDRRRERASADPRLAAPQRARQAALRVAAQPRARGRDGEYPRRPRTASPRQYGVEIIDVRIKKADLPDGTPLQSAFERMLHRPPAGSALDPRRGRQAGADHPRRRRRRGRPDLCRQLRQGPGILRFLPGDAVLPDDVPRRRQRASRRRRPSFCRRRTTI